jgi:putative NADH-flavin reductase
MRVVIAGGHGKIALLLEEQLSSRGDQPVGIVRNPDHVTDVEATGAAALVSSVEETDRETLAAQLTGQDAVIWSAGAGGGDPARTYAVDRDAAIRSMDAAADADVRRYVMVSFSGSFEADLVPEDQAFRHYQVAKIAADEHLRGTDLDWTILGPGTLTLEPSTGSVNPEARFMEGDRTSRELVAQVALAVLEDERTYGRTLLFGDGDVPVEEWLGSLT